MLMRASECNAAQFEAWALFWLYMRAGSYNRIIFVFRQVVLYNITCFSYTFHSQYHLGTFEFCWWCDPVNSMDPKIQAALKYVPQICPGS